MNHTARPLRGLLLTTSLLLSPALFAQVPASAPADAGAAEATVQLDAFVVTDVKSTQTTLPVRPVSSVYGFDTAAQDIPRSITQVNTKQFKEDVITNFNDFARYAPSVNKNTGSSLQHFGSPSIRGAVSDLYQNGVRSMVRQGNTRPFQLNAYEAVDIVAGPAPVIYGPSARTAGYVNFITKKPYFDKPQTEINTTIGKLTADGSYQDITYQIDTGGPLIPGKLAYRLSYQEQNADGYYRAGYNKWRDIYGTLAWLPRQDLTVDWNFEYGYYDYLPTGAWNRITQDLIDNGTYLAGAATPIIQGTFSPTGFYSPVANPSTGQFDGTTFIVRTPVAAQNKYTAGAALTGAPTPTQAGSVVAWVLDTANLTPVQLDPRTTLQNNDDTNRVLTKVFNTQLRVKKIVSEDVTIFNNTYYQYYWTDSHQNGGFYNAIASHIFENRTELVLTKQFKIGSLDIKHSSNTGFSYRFDEVKNVKDSDPAAIGAATTAYDLTLDPSTIARNALFGTQVYPLYFNQNPFYSPKFGWLRMQTSSVPSPFNASYGVTPGGSGTGLSTTSNHTTQHAASLYSQHSFKINERWIWDLGVRATANAASIKNPLIDPTRPNSVAADVVDHTVHLIPGGSTSLSYKIAPWITAYGTYAYVQAQNGMTTGTPVWSTGNRLSAKAFHSVSELYEGGFKTELIPSRLYVSLSAYEQTRDLAIVSYQGNSDVAKGLYRGTELSLRYEPTRQLTLGAGYNYLGATYIRNNAGTTATVADNATALLGSVTGFTQAPGDYRIPNLPRNTGSAYATYQFNSGFGLRTEASLRDSYIITGDGTVIVPSAFNLNVGAFYRQPKWTVSVDVTNVTDERNFNGDLIAEPIGVQGRFSLRF